MRLDAETTSSGESKKQKIRAIGGIEMVNCNSTRTSSNGAIEACYAMLGIVNLVSRMRACLKSD